jgi:hypothetical protein
MVKKKQTRSERLRATMIRAGEVDARRQDQISNQIKSIERLVAAVGLQGEFIRDSGLEDEWQAFYLAAVEHRTAEPCYICGQADNHLGVPHGLITGDGRTRADADKEAAATPSA